MSITFEDVSDQFRRITISGRLDAQGADAIAIKFASLTATAARRIVVDLSGVSFLASIGIRAFVTNAKALKQRGGKMVLFTGNNEIVSKTLESTGIDTLIPMFADAAEAENAANA
jgi:anti-anti-sigma factor